MPDSKRSSKGFQQIPEGSPPMKSHPNGNTVNIPLTGVTSHQTGGRSGTFHPSHRQPTYPEQPMNEKSNFYNRHVAGRRKAVKKTAGRRGDDGEEDALTQMGLIYNKILNFSILTRYLLYILPVGIIISIPIIIGATAARNATLGGVRIVWFFTWVLIVWLSLWVSKLFAKCLPSIFQFLCGIVSSGTRKYALVIKALELYLSLSGWALASLATFIPVMTRNPTQRSQKATYTQQKNSTVTSERNDALKFQFATDVKPWETTVQRILAALLVSSLILLAVKLLIQLITISYHRTQFNSKIKDSKHRIHLLSLLYDASRSLFPAYCAEFVEEDYIINDSIELGDSKPKGHHRSGSTTPMRLLQNVGRFGDHVTSAFGNIAQEVTGKQVFNPNAAHSIVVEALEKNRSSEALAKRLWMSFVVEGKEALYLEDIVEVLGPERRGAAEEAFDALDRDGNGDISLDEMILTVCEFGRERHSITNSLHDVDQAIHVLDNLLCTIVFIVCIFIFVAFLNTSLVTTLATAGTALLSLSFVFAGTCQEVLSSCIFLFVKHPFDVLDVCTINGDRMVVKHISLLSTVFKYVDSHKQTQVPNTVLNTLWIQNVSRSEAMREQLSVFVSFDTSLEDIQLLKHEMRAFVTDKDNARDFLPDIDIEVVGIAEMNKMELSIEIRHKSNWSNETVRAARRSKFMCALVLALRKIPINAPGGGSAALGSADQPSYTVAVTDAQAAASRDAYKDSQNAKRLFPITKEDPPPPPKSPTKGVSSGVDTPTAHDSATPAPLRLRQNAAEAIALNALNTRHPAADTAKHPSDLIEPATPKSATRTVSVADTLPDLDRTTSIEEVRGLLHRESTRGKRKSPKVSASTRLPPTTEIASPPPSQPVTRAGMPSSKIDYVLSPKFEYDPYAYVAPPYSSISAPVREDSAAGPPPQAAQAYRIHTQQQQQSSSQSAQSESPIIHPQYQPKTITDVSGQQRPPPAQSSSQPRTAPAIVPPPTSYQPPVPPKSTPPASSNPTTSRPPHQQPVPAAGPSSQQQQPYTQEEIVPPTTVPGEIHQRREGSPIRNPFQITALKSQAQGASVPRAVPRPPSEGGGTVHHYPQPSNGNGSSSGNGASRFDGQPQVRRPLPSEPGNGNANHNAFAREREAGMLPPPRGDSLGQQE